jgi:hypothetical protein
VTGTLQRDLNSVPVQSLIPQSPVSVALSGSSQLLAIPAGTKFLRVAATGNAWIEFGTGSAVATTSSLLFPGGVEVFPITNEITHLAVLQVGASTGFISINRMK